MNKVLSKYPIIAIVFFVSMIFLAHLLAIPDYSWTSNTVSELAAQGYPLKWIMQIGFIGFGSLIVIGICSNIYNQNSDLWIDIPIGIYAMAIIVSGIFCTRPFMVDEPFSPSEAQIHSVGASVAGFMFSIGILVNGLKAKPKPTKLIHFVFLVFVIGMSALFGMSSTYQRAFQKIMYLGSFVWLGKFYGKK